MTFLVSAVIVWRLPIPRRERADGHAHRLDRDLPRDQGRACVHRAQQPLVRGVIIGLGVGLIGAGRDDPARSGVRQGGADGGERGVRRADDRARVRRRVRRGRRCCGSRAGCRARPVFEFAVIGTGAFLVLAASFSSLAPAALFIGGVGACAGTSYVTGFTVLQENVERRAPRAHLRHALHRHPAVPADLAHHLAVVGRLLGLGHQAALRPTRPSSIGPVLATRSPACASRSGAAGSSRSSPGSSRGARSQARAGRER